MTFDSTFKNIILENGVGKIRNFQPISRRISETVQDKPNLLLMTNRKSHTLFRLLSKSTTLDDLERPLWTLSHKRCASFGAHNKNLNEDRSTMLAAEMLADDSSFCLFKVYADIRGGSLGRGVKRQWDCRQRQFSAFSLVICSETLEIRSALLYSDTQSVVSFSMISKCLTFNDHEWLFRVKFCFSHRFVWLPSVQLSKKMRENW